MRKDVHCFHKRHTGPKAGAKKKRGVDLYLALDLLSSAAIDILGVRHSQVF
jgi:hypothetical protein